MKKIISLILVVGLAALAYLVLQKGSFPGIGSTTATKLKGFDGKVHYQFVELAEGVIGQSGPYQVRVAEVERTAPMRAFRNKERDLLFALIYKQFVTDVKEPVAEIQFSFKKVSVSPNTLLTKYGISEQRSTQIKFSAFPESEGLAKVDGRLIERERVNFSSFIWAAHETEVFRYKLSAVDRILKQKWVDGESQKLKMRPRDYEEKYVYEKLEQEISDNDIKAFLNQYNIEDSERNRSSARNNLLRKRKQRGLDYVLEKYVMELPIKIDLTRPNFALDEKAEWTATLGDPNGVAITVFSDTRQATSVRALKSLFEVLQGYQKVKLQYRPFFQQDDPMQRMTSTLHMCALKNAKQHFWDFFSATLGDSGMKTEAELFAVVKKMGLGEETFKACLADPSVQEIVDYHKKYADYLGITASPVIYIGGEVLHGVIQQQDIEEILQRQMGLPAAGMW